MSNEFKHNGKNMEIGFSIEYVEDMGYVLGYEYRNDNIDSGVNEGDNLGEFDTLGEAIAFLKENVENIIKNTYYFE